MKKKIVISSNNPAFNFSNKNSAVALYLTSVAALLSSQYEVVKHPNYKNKDSKYIFSNQGRLKKYIKKLFLLFFTYLKENKYIKNQKDYVQQFWEKSLDPHVLIEFLSYGQSLTSHQGSHGTKTIIIYDCPLFTQYQEMNPNKSFILHEIMEREKEAVMAADGLIVYSEAVLKSLHEQGLINTQEVLVLPAIAFDRLTSFGEKKFVSNEVNIGFIGSFLVWHKVSLLVKVFEDLAVELNNINLYLVGYGEEWENIRLQVSASKFSDRIHLTGYISDDSLCVIKKKLDIGVMPGSNWYGSPLKIFEYGALGIAVVAPNEPTIVDCFKENLELLIIDKKYEYRSLKNIIKKLVVNEKLRKLLGKRIKSRMHLTYNKKRYKEELNHLVEKVLEK